MVSQRENPHKRLKAGTFLFCFCVSLRNERWVIVALRRSLGSSSLSNCHSTEQDTNQAGSGKHYRAQKKPRETGLMARSVTCTLPFVPAARRY